MSLRLDFYAGEWAFSYEEQIWYDEDLDPRLRTSWMEVARRGIIEELALKKDAIIESYFLSTFHNFEMCSQSACVLSLLEDSADFIRKRLHVARRDWEAERLEFIPISPAVLAEVLLNESWEDHVFKPMHPSSKYRLFTAGKAIYGVDAMLNALDQMYKHNSASATPSLTSGSLC